MISLLHRSLRYLKTALWTSDVASDHLARHVPSYNKKEKKCERISLAGAVPWSRTLTRAPLHMAQSSVHCITNNANNKCFITVMSPDWTGLGLDGRNTNFYPCRIGSDCSSSSSAAVKNTSTLTFAPPYIMMTWVKNKGQVVYLESSSLNSVEVALTPKSFTICTSSLYLWYESHAVSPVLWSSTRSGRSCVIVSQILTPFPKIHSN